jgi:hypothetical protein
MTEDELAQIESELKICLPSAYRHTMLGYPFSECSWPSQAEIPKNQVFVLGINRAQREDEKYNAVWKHQFFAFGNDSGWLYFSDTSLCPSPVFRIDIESHEVSEDAPTLQEWIDRRIEWGMSTSTQIA